MRYIPHNCLRPSDICFNSRVIADLLPGSEGAGVSVRPSVQPGGITGCTRHRGRKGGLLIIGKKRKLWLSQWPEGNKRMSRKLGWRDAMSRSQAACAHRQWIEKIKAYFSSMFSAAIRLFETGIARNPVLGVGLPSRGLEPTPANLTAEQARLNVTPLWEKKRKLL